MPVPVELGCDAFLPGDPCFRDFSGASSRGHDPLLIRSPAPPLPQKMKGFKLLMWLGLSGHQSVPPGAKETWEISSRTKDSITRGIPRAPGLGPRGRVRADVYTFVMLASDIKLSAAGESISDSISNEGSRHSKLTTS